MKTINVIIVEPMKPARISEIESSLESMQNVVGGYIEQYMPFEDDAAIVCNDEGKICAMGLNRAIFDENGNMTDIIAGTFFICRAPADSENFESLTQHQLSRYMDMFRSPEVFLRTNNEIVSLKIEQDDLL